MIEKWNLSSFDKFCLKMNIKGAWLFHQLPDFKSMGDSLCELLGSYPFLLGRYSQAENAILYETNAPTQLPQGIFSEYSRPDVTVGSLIDSDTQGLRKASAVWSLAPAYDLKGFLKGSVCPFSASLVHLADGELLIVSGAHACMDGYSFYSLVGQWAELCKGGSITALRVDQSPLPSPTAFSKEEATARAQQAGWQIIGAKKLFKMLWNMVKSGAIKKTYCIEVPQERIQNLRARSGAGTNAVLCAIAAKKLYSRLPGIKSFKLIFTADLRGHFPGIDGKFFGNFSQATPAGVDFDTETPVAKLAADIDCAVKAVLGSQTPENNVRISVCASEYGLPYFYFDASDMNCSKPGSVYINNQLKFRPAEMDWGKGQALYAFPNELSDMVKLWQPAPGGPVQIIYGGLAAAIMEKRRK